MACDISKIFLSTVRALRTSDPKASRKVSTASSSSSSSTVLRPLADSCTDSFSSRARNLSRELNLLRNHITQVGQLSSALASQDTIHQNLYHKLAKQTNDALDQCSLLLRQLRQAESCGHVGPQTREHRGSVCRLLEDTWNQLKRRRDGQLTKYCRRLEITGRLGVGDGVCRRRAATTKSSGIYPFSGSSRLMESADIGVRAPEELQALETENAAVYHRLVSERSEVQDLGASISEIGRLQSIITENLVVQSEKAEQVGENIIDSAELIREANDKLREAMDRTKGVRFWIIFLMLLFTFSLHFLDWYR